MPVQVCTADNKPGFKWGDQGKCFSYTSGNVISRNRAMDKALAQGRAIKAAGGK